jgi:hypothetical protein
MRKRCTGHFLDYFGVLNALTIRNTINIPAAISTIALGESANSMGRTSAKEAKVRLASRAVKTKDKLVADIIVTPHTKTATVRSADKMKKN